MGCFSWMFGDEPSKALNIGEKGYLLVPEEFEGEYGKAIKEIWYDGYGRFGEYDVYELVAIWNKKYIPFSINEDGTREYPFRTLKAKRENYGGLWLSEKAELKEKGYSDEQIAELDELERDKHYKNALAEIQMRAQRLTDFMEMSLEEFEAKYRPLDTCGNWLRSVGIDIACYDEDNEKLKYPIAITKQLLPYNRIYRSKGDPCQGFGHEMTEDDEYT